jgi:hypothetical protein
VILRPEIEPTEQEVVDYYKAHYDEVHVVSCTKCGEDLAVEVRGDVPGLRRNDNGCTVIPISEKLLSSRVRLDGLSGYQCLCGNDTRSNAFEEEASPRGEFLPHEVERARRKMDEAKWKPLVRNQGNKQHRETFVAERVK